MTMYYSQRDIEILERQMREREQQKITDEGKRIRNSAALRKKAIPVRKPAERHA